MFALPSNQDSIYQHCKTMDNQETPLGRDIGEIGLEIDGPGYQVVQESRD
jgi:hypothetical protein